MSTITKELAKLFRKITNSEIDSEGSAHAVLSPADSTLINRARIALASLEAEPVGTFKKGPCGYYPSFHEDAVPLYTAPPAPVSVPAAMEMDDDFDSAFEHGKAVGWNACRAAMLQSFGNSEQLNSPVIPDGWVACSERMPETYVNVLLTDEAEDTCIGQLECEDDGHFCINSSKQRYKATHWMPLPAAPQQEVKNG